MGYRPKGKSVDLTKVHPPQQPSSIHYDGTLEELDARVAQRHYLYRILANGEHWSDIEMMARDVDMVMGALAEVYALIGCEMAFEAVKMRRSTIYQEKR